MNVIRFKFRNHETNKNTLEMISNFFENRCIDARVGEADDGYVVALHSVCRRDLSSIDDPIAKLVFDVKIRQWRLLWLSDNFSWTHFSCYYDVLDALRTLLLFYQTAE